MFFFVDFYFLKKKIKFYLNCKLIHLVLILMLLGKITPIIQQTFSLAQLPDAMEMMEQRKIEGKLVLDMTL